VPCSRGIKVMMTTKKGRRSAKGGLSLDVTAAAVAGSRKDVRGGLSRAKQGSLGSPERFSGTG